MSYSQAEIKSGLLVSIAFVLLLGLTFIVGGFLKGGGQEFQVQFGYVSGLGDNAPVYFAGREVGKVSSIDIVNDTEKPVRVTVKVADHVRLRSDSAAFIDTLGLMGEKFVELSPGTVGADAIAPGTVIMGTDPIPMHLMVRRMNLLAERMEVMTDSLNPMMEKLNTMMVGHEEEIAAIIGNANEISANLRDMTHDLKYRPWRLLRKG